MNSPKRVALLRKLQCRLRLLPAALIAVTACTSSAVPTPPPDPTVRQEAPLIPFTDIAPDALGVQRLIDIRYPGVAGSTPVTPSMVMPPESLDAANVEPCWQVPTGLAAYDFGFGAAFFDYENDGDVDMIGTNSSGELLVAGRREYVSGPLFVWRSGGENHWLTLRLKGRMAVDGTGSNADAIGDRVFVEDTLDGTTTITQVQEVLGSSTFLSMNSLDLTFGPGDATSVDRINIRWPSGIEQVLENVEVDRVLDIAKPPGK